MSYKVQHFFEGGAWKGMYTRASLSSSDHHLGKGLSPGGQSSFGRGVSPRPSNPNAL